MMTIAQIMEKMIAFSEGNIHDITHLSCVWTYAKTIGELEGLDADTQFILEVAAITHDIACSLRFRTCVRSYRSDRRLQSPRARSGECSSRRARP